MTKILSCVREYLVLRADDPTFVRNISFCRNDEGLHETLLFIRTIENQIYRR